MSFSDWKIYKLGDLVTFQRGHDLAKSEFVDGEFPIAGSNGIIGYHNKFTTKAPSLTVGRSGNLGTPHFYNENFWAHNTTLYVKEFHKSDPRFIYYLLQTLDLKQFNSGSAVPSLNRNYIHPIEVIAPDLKTQQRIASILSCLDDAIELNQQINKTLEEMAKAIFKEWFVDFNFPNATGKFQETEIGKIPVGWKVGRLGDVIEVKGGTTPSTTKKEYWDGEYYWTSPRDLSNLQTNVLLDTSKKITALGVKQISSGILPKGTLLLSSRAPIGYLAISEVPISINQGFIAINGTKVSNLFMLYWLKENMQTIINNANGSTFLEISKTVFRNIPIAIPSSEVLEKFEEIISSIYNQILNNEKENQSLSNLRDTLLPKLMKGEIEISEK